VAQPEKDDEFERYIESESPGVIDSARSRYYGESYDRLFAPVVTAAPPPGDRMLLYPVHTDAENARAESLVSEYSDHFPERAMRYGFQE